VQRDAATERSKSQNAGNARINLSLFGESVISLSSDLSVASIPRLVTSSEIVPASRTAQVVKATMPERRCASSLVTNVLRHPRNLVFPRAIPGSVLPAQVAVVVVVVVVVVAAAAASWAPIVQRKTSVSRSIGRPIDRSEHVRSILLDPLGDLATRDPPRETRLA